MRCGAIVSCLLALAATAGAETVNLREAGRLEIFAAGEWKIASEDQGDRFVVTITPKRDANAGARLVVNITTTDDSDTKPKLRQRVLELCQQFVPESAERKATVQEFYRKSGFGFYCTFTDPALIGKPPEPGNFKLASYGVVRLAPKIYVAVTLLGDDLYGPAYQALLGAVEGMEHRPPR